MPVVAREAVRDFVATYTFERRLTPLAQELKPGEAPVVSGFWQVSRMGTALRLTLVEEIPVPSAATFAGSARDESIRAQQDWFYDEGTLVAYVIDGMTAVGGAHLPAGAPIPPFLAPLDVDFGLALGEDHRIGTVEEMLSGTPNPINVDQSRADEVEYRQFNTFPSEVGEQQYVMIHGTEPGGMGLDRQWGILRLTKADGSRLDVPLRKIDATRGVDGYAQQVTVRDYLQVMEITPLHGSATAAIEAAAEHPERQLLGSTATLTLATMRDARQGEDVVRFIDFLPYIKDVHVNGVTNPATPVRLDPLDPSSPAALAYDPAARDWVPAAANP
jgi:hypothetical protein